MKKYKLITIVLLLLCSCSSDLLEQTIYIPDPDDSNLPAYTELGYNSFGVKYERMYFTATSDIVPCKIVYQNGVMSFSLNGRIGAGYYSSYYGNEEMSLIFSFPTSQMNEYQDLIVLNNTTIDLTGASCEVKMIRNSQPEVLTVLSGNLTFKRAQLLSVDDKENRAILSGTFDLKFVRNNVPEVMSNGRFDLGITDLFNLPD